MLVTFKDFDGGTIEVNPASVVSVDSFNHYDHDAELPDEFFIENSQGLKELSADFREKADKLRTSSRTFINVNGTTYVVKGSVADVKKALGTPAPKAKAKGS